MVLAQLGALALVASGPARSDCTDPIAAGSPARPSVLISDLHFGAGRVDGTEWLAAEDFRWPDALDGFLRFVSAKHSPSVDLVVLGDFLELWQPPEQIKCDGHGANLGCSVSQTRALVELVVKAHAHELKALGDFAQQAQHRLVIVPGNHDSALTVDEIWKPLAVALGDCPTRVLRQKDGVWKSGRILAEHGHQIGSDVNKYSDWPTVTASADGEQYLIRPWGERFVQVLFNAVERQYPIIDNIGPESAGAKYRMATEGAASTAGDLARFVLFNLFQTSIRQKVQVLGSHGDEPPQWDVNRAKLLGHELVAAGLPPGDPLRTSIEQDDAQELRDALKQQVAALSDDEIRQLCDHASLYGPSPCIPQQLGAAAQALINTKKSVLKQHVLSRQGTDGAAKYFVYGHTHELEQPWDLQVSPTSTVIVANTGAFQRVIGESDMGGLVRTKKLKDKDALLQLKPEDLFPCYSYVVVDENKVPAIQTRFWVQPEQSDDGSSRKTTDRRCHPE